MDKLYLPLAHKLGSLPTKRLNQKVFALLVAHAYQQTLTGVGASLFCACIILVSAYAPGSDNFVLHAWFVFFLVVAVYRIILADCYLRYKSKLHHVVVWRNLFVIGATLAGVCWGSLSIILLPHISAEVRPLLFLLMAGVTAGAVPLMSPIPGAAISFLLTCSIPFILAIVMLHERIYLFFDMALTIYIIYLIAMSMKAYHTIRNSILLQFENDELLESLSEAKRSLEQSNKRLQLSATHDPLTQVANRRLFETNLAEAMLRAEKNHKMLALFYLDIDRFKQINDQYGHEAGDKILLIITDRMRKYLRKSDMIARLGGDELSVILENISQVEEIYKIAGELCQMLALPIMFNQTELKVSASVGVSIYPGDGKTVEELIQYADRAMYQVKEQGGNNFYRNRRQAST